MRGSQAAFATRFKVFLVEGLGEIRYERETDRERMLVGAAMLSIQVQT